MNEIDWLTGVESVILVVVKKMYMKIMNDQLNRKFYTIQLVPCCEGHVVSDPIYTSKKQNDENLEQKNKIEIQLLINLPPHKQNTK